MKTLGMDIEKCENFAKDRSRWRRDLHQGLLRRNGSLHPGEKRAERKESHTATSGENVVICIRCNRDCPCRVDLYSHNKCWAAISSRDRIDRQINLCVQIHGLSYSHAILSIYTYQRIMESLNSMSSFLYLVHEDFSDLKHALRIK